MKRLYIKAWIGDLAAYNAGDLRGEWVDCSDREAMERAADVYSNGGETETFVADYDTNTGLNLGEYENIDALCALAEELDALESWQVDVFCAVCEVELVRSAEKALDIVKNIDDWMLLDNIDTCEQLGYYYATEMDCIDLDRLGDLANYFDFEAYGRDIAYGGDFTSYGFLEHIA